MNRKADLNYPDTDIIRYEPLFQYSSIPCNRHKAGGVRNYILSIGYRNEEQIDPTL